MRAEAVEAMDSMPTQTEDAALLRAFCERNDRQAMNALFARHADTAYRVALRLCRNSADAEDAVQTAFIEVLRRAGQYRGESAVKPWILGFVVNATRHKAREEGRRDAREEKAAQRESVPPAPAAAELQQAVRSAVQQLPEHYRAPVWLHYCEGLSSGEVAQALSLSENTVRSQLSRGVEQLREALAVSASALIAALSAAAVESAPASLTASLTSLAANALPAAVGGAVKTGVLAKLAAGTVALAAVVSTVAFVGWGGVPDDPAPPDLESVERRVREWQPRPDERRFDEIAWAKDLGEAIRLAKGSGRPVFVLAHVAHVNTGRGDGGAMSFREGPLSDTRVITMLNRRTVPVYCNSDDRANVEHHRIYREALAKKLEAGSEHLYFLGPDGGVLSTMHVCNTKTPEFLAWLEKHSGPEGEPLVAPRPQSVPPPADGLVLHITARYLDKDGKVDLRKGDYHAFPAEEWMVLDGNETSRLLPPEPARKGSEIDVDAALSGRILSRLYPLTGNFTDPSTNMILDRILKARVVAVRKDAAWVRLEGRVRMEHSFYPSKEERPVEAAFTGYLVVDVNTKRVRSARVATDRAMYGKEPFGVAIRSIP